MKSKIKIVTLFASLFFASTCLANLCELEIFAREINGRTQYAHVFTDDYIDFTLDPASLVRLNSSLQTSTALSDSFHQTAQAMHLILEKQFAVVKSEIIDMATYDNPPAKILVITSSDDSRSIFFNDITNPNISIDSTMFLFYMALTTNPDLVDKLQKASGIINNLEHAITLMLNGTKTADDNLFIAKLYERINQSQIDECFFKLFDYFAAPKFNVELKNLKCANLNANRALMEFCHLPQNFEQLLVSFKKNFSQYLNSRPLNFESLFIIDGYFDDVFIFEKAQAINIFKEALLKQGFKSIIKPRKPEVTYFGFEQAYTFIDDQIKRYPDFFNSLDAQLAQEQGPGSLRNVLAIIFNLNINGCRIVPGSLDEA